MGDRVVETLAKASRGDDPAGMEARVAVLEQIAADTWDALKEIKGHLLRLEESHKADFRRLEEGRSTDFRRLEDDFRRLAEHQRSDFRLLLSAGAAAAIGLAALMAHGFHWF
jgi:hypothetical protein